MATPGEGGEAFPYVEGKSLDRKYFPAEGLLLGGPAHWEAKDAPAPLVLPLRGFGWVRRGA
jgi:hypothetical protein